MRATHPLIRTTQYIVSAILAVALVVGIWRHVDYALLLVIGGLLAALLAWLLATHVWSALHGFQNARLDETRFGAFLDRSPKPIIAADTSGTLVRVNPAYGTMVGCAADALIGRRIESLVFSEDAALTRQLFGELVAGKRDRYRITRRAERVEGDPVWTQVSGFSAGDLQIEIVEDVSELRRAEENRRSAEARFATQHATIHALAGAESLEDAISGLLQALCEEGGWQVGAFWSIDARRENLHCAHVWHMPQTPVPQFETVTRTLALGSGEGLPGRVWEASEPQFLDDLAAEKTVLRALKGCAEGLKSGYGFPVLFEGRVHGVIELMSTRSRRREELFMPEIKTIGGLIGRFFERERADETLRASEERYRTITEIAHDAVITIDEESRILSINQAAERIFGYDREELVGQLLTILMPENVRAAHRDGMQRYLTTGKRRIRWDAVELQGVHRDGREILLEISLAEFTQNGKRAFTGYVRDITERKLEESQLVYQALHDALTDLPNRTLLTERLEQAILVAQRHENPVALLMMDLDRFKEVNDTFGHHSGDTLLQQVSQRLLGTIRESDTVARLGGDEFAVLLPATDQAGAVLAAERIIEALRRPFGLEGRDLDIGVSIGVSLFPLHGNDGATLMRRADVAMYAAKRGAGDFSVYSPDRDANNSLRLLMTSELRHAIESDQLILHYQPKVELSDGTTKNVEALVRWIHPERGFTPPDEFIPLAEETGLVKPLTVWVLNESLRQHSAWRKEGHDIRVAVNFSARTLHDPDLVPTVTGLLEKWDVEPSRLEIEITESAIMLDPDRAMKTLTDLHDAGIWTSIDDFGTGYSSLGYLRKLPVDEIKIDKSFVLDMATNRDDASIVRSIVSLGHHLGLQVVAEGVDNRRTLDMLTEMGCDHAQGFFLSRPVPSEKLSEWLQGPKPRLSVVS